MTRKAVKELVPAAFHAGERALQREAGVEERLAERGPRLLHRELPAQLRDFFEEVEFVVVGSVDDTGQPLASLVAGPSGFVTSLDSTRLQVQALPLAGDPLRERIEVGSPVGLLGMLPHLRRRNRANGTVESADANGFTVTVAQAFGNCPKYISERFAMFVGTETRQPPPHPGKASDLSRAGNSETARRVRDLVERADTFFIASAHPEARLGNDPRHGVDVSHRGGPPGFARFVDDAVFAVPDFRGNNYFNTLGNVSLNDRVGLLFLDLATRDVLQLEGRASVLRDAHSFEGAEQTGRVVRFAIQRFRIFAAASPLEFLPL